MVDEEHAERSGELRIPPPPPATPHELLAVGRFPPSHVGAEDFSRRLGNWGDASRLIGDRWEAAAPRALHARLPWQAPLGGGRAMAVLAVLELDADPEAGRILQRAGVSAPDLLLVGQAGTGERYVLRAADCKVSLDTAEREQTAPGRLQATFTRIHEAFPGVATALRRQAAALPEAQRAVGQAAIESALAARWTDVSAGEGLFVAPRSGFNVWFLEQLERRRRTGEPLPRLPFSGPRRPSEEVSGPVTAALSARLTLPAHLEAIDARTFLSELPGWAEAEIVAELDGVRLDAVDLAIAERCWRVGTGLRGAVLALRRKLFQAAISERRPDGAPREVSQALRQVIARRKPADSAGLIAAVAHSVAARRPLWERETALLHVPVPYGTWTYRLGEASRASRATSNGAAADPQRARRGASSHLRAARALYREATRRHRQRVLAAAHALLEAGIDEEALLTQLEGRAAEWQAAVEADATHLAASVDVHTDASDSEAPDAEPAEPIELTNVDE